MTTQFKKLNTDWNADPNVPLPRVSVDGADVLLEFRPNIYLFPKFTRDHILRLRFKGAVRYRLGEPNDEGWYRGQCRFSSRAREWGQFYQVTGDLRLSECLDEWITIADASSTALRHFLFYLRDETFECSAKDWQLEILDEREKTIGDILT